MTAVMLHARAVLRQRYRSWAAITVLIALAGGAVLALAAGARRTDSAYPRFLAATGAADAVTFLGQGGPVTEANVRRLANVVDVATADLPFSPRDYDLIPIVLTDPRLGTVIDRFKFLSGRAPGRDRADEVAVSFVLARQRHLHVGSMLTIHVPTATNPAQPLPVRVVGIEAAAWEFPPTTFTNLPVYLSPAFLKTAIGASSRQPGASAIEMAVRLRHGAADAPRLQGDLQRLLPESGGVQTIGDQSANVRRSMHFQAVALWLAAAFVTLAMGIVLTQLLSRQAMEDGADNETVRALGFTRSDLFGSGMLRVAVVAATAVGGAVAIAALLSPLLPLGTARIAEPHNGFAFDGLALGLGGAGVFIVVALIGGGVMFRAARGAGVPDVAQARPARFAGVVAAARLPLTSAMGVRLALDPGRGRSAVPVRATLAAVAVGVASMAAAVTFSASLGHLFAAPALYGTTFDAHVTAADNAGGDLGPSVASMRNDPAVDAVFVGWDSLFMRSGRVNFGTQAGMTAKGSFHPTVLAGRSPDAPNEILLGSRTMRDLHAHIGATVPVEIAGLTRPIPMRVVGRGVLPAMADTEQLGTGAVVAPSALRAFAAKGPPGLSVPPPTDLFVRLRRGVATTTGLAELQNRLGGPALVVVAPAKQPTDISNFGQVRDLPQLLAGLLAALAVGTMVYLLVTAARRRRHDLAVLKVLGLDPRQVSAVMMWSATTITALALLVGLPAGVAAGRWMWMYVADQLGVVPRPTVPVLLALLFVPVAVVLGNVVAALPARAAARIPAADVLRRD